MKRTIQLLQEFSIPLIAGVICAMLWANVSPDTYQALIHTPLHHLGDIFAHHATDAGEHSGWDHYLTLHFLINDVFMALFFGIAAKEIVEACLPGGALNPLRKAVNPLFATVGGVLGPVVLFLLLNSIVGRPEWVRGWGIPTATDIALAWLVARFVFGARHAAVSFLLLLAVADDAIGLGIIAFGYPDPNHPTQWMNLLWCLPGMGVAYGLRLNKVRAWWPYILIGGAFCWWGLYSAHLHPALALVFVVPFLPGPDHDLGFFVEEEDDERPQVHSPLENFEHALKLPVDFGLFLFALINAGVAFADINTLSWIVVAALIPGKMIGITGFGLLARRLGFPLPEGMGVRHLIVTSAVAGLGLTVALFVCGQAFTDTSIQAAARMGAVFSASAAILAYALKMLLQIQPAAASSQPAPLSSVEDETLQSLQDTKHVVEQALNQSDDSHCEPATSGR